MTTKLHIDAAVNSFRHVDTTKQLRMRPVTIVAGRFNSAASLTLDPADVVTSASGSAARPVIELSLKDADGKRAELFFEVENAVQLAKRILGLATGYVD